ncbi:endonuclease VIII [Chloroflexota bacterium]
MIELPEAVNLSNQLNDTVFEKRIIGVAAVHTPHKLAWYYGEPPTYSDLLIGRTIGKASPFGSMVEIEVENANILFGEGVNVRFHDKEDPRPAKHQLLIEFEDHSAVSFSVQMYGGIGAFINGELDNPYYEVAREKPSPLSPAFNEVYFDRTISTPEVQKLSLKALLATEQRIPGLGNGVLQDILFNAKMHPKKKMNTLMDKDKEALFNSIRATLSAMASQGGRDTESDLFVHAGRYKTILSKNTVSKPCPVCGTMINKETYMGGSVYYCEKCQRL